MMSPTKKSPAKKAATVKVPEIGQDATERKRLLNVLAQRRYRQRKKEHIKNLEAQVASPISLTLRSVVQDNQRDISPSSPPEQSKDHSTHHSGLGIVFDDHQASDPITPCSVIPQQPCTQDPLTALSTSPTLENALDFPIDLPLDWSFSDQDLQLLLDPQLPLPALDSTPHSTTESSSSHTELNSSSTSPSSTNSYPHLHDLALSNTHSEPGFDFPDEAHFRILELDLLRATMTIAKRMHIDDLLWQLTATSPYTDPSMRNMSFEHLPINLWPTEVQLTIPHHPMLDLLPWPTVRNKLLRIFSQPLELRPPSAASPTAMLDLVYDFEDSAEGVRVWGNDPCSNLNWEIGQKVFERWWWAFDRDIINRSNEIRKGRGAPLLSEGFVVGEIA